MPQTAADFLEGVEDSPDQAKVLPSAREFLDEAPSAKAFLDEDSPIPAMAAATRATVGVVGRAIAARDFAAAGYDAPDRLDLEQPDESSLAPLPGNVEPKAVQAAPAMLTNFGKAIMTPIPSALGIPIPRITSQEVADALSYLASTADMPAEYSEALRLEVAKPGNLEKIIAGAQRAAVSVPEAFTSPFGIATMGAGALPGTAGRVVAGGFAVDMASHIPEQVGQLKDAIASGDSERITEASGNLLATGAMTAATGKHALTSQSPGAVMARGLDQAVREAEFVDPKLAALNQVAPLTAEAVAKVNPEPTPQLKPGDVLPVEVPIPAEAAVYRTPDGDLRTVTRQPDGQWRVTSWAIGETQPEPWHHQPFKTREEAVRDASEGAEYIGQQLPRQNTWVSSQKVGDGTITVTTVRDPVDNMMSLDLHAEGSPSRGTGAATKMYMNSLRLAQKEGAGLISDSIMSDSARAIYERLIKQGIPFEKNDAGQYVISAETLSKLNLSPSPTPLTTEAVAKVVEKEPVPPPAPTPAAVAGESGKPAPVTAGVEPPAKQSVTPEVTTAKPEGERTLTTEPVAKVQAEVRKMVTYRVPATGANKRFIKVGDEWFKADSRWNQQGKNPLEPSALRDALDAQVQRETAANAERSVTLDDGRTIKVRGEGAATYWTDPTITSGPGAGYRLASPEFRRQIEGAAKPESSEPQGAIGTPGAQLQPERRFATRLTPKSQREIITDISKGLDLPIRFGRLRTNRFAGYFLKLQNLIGSKRANDIPIVSHEAGHKLDATFDFSGNPALRAELEMLGDPAAIAGSRSSWTKSKSLKYKRGEGVAEFVRHWLTDPAAATQHAPAMERAFNVALDSNKDFGTTMRQAQSDIQTWRNAEPQARLRSHISVGGNPNATPYTLDQLTRDVVDDLHFLRMAANDAKVAGTDLSPSQNPYTLARTLRGSYGMADSFIRSGVADFKTREVTLGTSLQDALKPVSGRIADFRDWIIAKRAQELHGQGRQTGLVDSDIAFTAAKFDADPAFVDAFAKVKAWQDSLLKYAEDAGFVTPEGAAKMREMNEDYVPLHRVFEVGAGEASAVEGAGTGRGLNVGKPGSLRRLTGSARDIVDPLETMVRNAYAIITASEKHAINIAVADMARLPDMGKWVEHIATPKERVQVGVEKLREQLENAGADMTAVPDDLLLQFFQNSKQAPFGENVIKVVRDGKPEFYRLKRELFETFHALDLEDSGTLVRMLSAPSQVLRAGVVLDPSFALANVMRDAFTSAIVSRHGLLPFEATFRGVAAMLKNPKMIAEWEASGGKNAIEANYFDRQKLQKFLAEKITKDLTPAERALIAVKSPLQALRWLTSLGEEATRIGEYQKAFEDFRNGGMSEGEARRQAAFESRDRQDFAKGGAKTKIPRRLAAFWNAGIQGNVRLAQAFREQPLQTTMKGLAFITIPKLIEQALNWDDEDYWDRPQWERDLFFLIPTGKGEDGHTRFIRIPTPFEAGVIFGTFPGRILQSVKEGSAANMKGFPLVLAQQTIPNPTPQFALTIFEDFLVGKKGYDVYRQRQIVPESIAQLPADMQWTEQTSLAARKLGAALGFPPVKIDHIINQTTGGLGKQLTHQVVDRAISLATGEARTARGIMPGGRFVSTPASVSSQSIEDFYTTLDKVKTASEGQKKGRDDALAQWRGTFEATALDLAGLRRAMRQTKDEAEKNRIAEQILERARDTMKNFREQTK